VAALLGIAGLVAAIVVFALLLRSEDQARRFGLLAGRVASRLVGRPPVAGWELATVKFRSRTIGLVEHRWVAVTLWSLVSHLSLYVVLLVALRDVGVSDAEVGWAEVLAVFAFARLATAIPLTPGGLGFVEGPPGGRKARSTPCAGWSSRRTTPCGCAATPACPAPDPTAWSSSPPNASTCWSPSSSPTRSSSAKPRSPAR
jgi:hypothetical protein